MRRTHLIAILAMLLIETSAATVSAQMFPGRRYGPGYYGGYYDSGALAAGVGLGSASSSERNAAQSYQSWRQQASSSQMSGMESGIRNSVNSGDRRYSQDLYNQQQANRDWWFQVQQQQVAQRQAAASRYAVPPAGFAAAPAGFEAASVPAAPKANSDIIKWLPLLQAPQFAAQRAQIEAPYRRSSKGLSIPTAEDYRNMLKAVGQMRVTLKGMTNDITAQQYLDADAFLNELAREINDRLGTAEPKK